MKVACGWKYWATLLLGSVPALGYGQQQSLTLQEAIRQALAQNPQTAAANADVRGAAAGASLARTALWPRLSATEDLSRGNDPVYVFGTKLRQQRFEQSDFSVNSLNRPTPTGNFATRLSGQWMLFNGWETQRQIRAAELGVASASSMSGAVWQAVAFRVVQAYQSVLYAQRQQAVARHEQETAEALLHDAQTRVNAGLAIDSDLLAAQVNLAARQEEVIATEGAAETAWEELATAMGQTDGARPAMRPLEAKNYTAGTLADGINAALHARPDLKALRQQADAEDETMKAARSDFFPQVSAYGNWEMDRQTFAGNGGNDWVAGAQISLDILPLGKRARLSQAQAAHAKAEAELRSQEQQIRLAVSRAFSGQQTAERILVTARASMEQSTESLRILRNRYDAGLATMTDLLRGEDAQRQSQNNYWQAAYANTTAYAGLLYATGQLTPESAESLQ
jgi:outer membrane protein